LLKSFVHFHFNETRGSRNIELYIKADSLKNSEKVPEELQMGEGEGEK